VEGTAGKVAIITGGATGLGAGLVRAFQSSGVLVAFADIKEAQGRELETELGSNVMFVRADIRSDADLDRLLHRTHERFGAVDFLVNVACSYAEDGLMSSRSAWQAVFDVNLFGHAVLIQKAVPYLARSGAGSIVNISSASAHIAQMGRWVYPASKAAIEQMTRSAALELAERGIRVNALLPGMIARQPDAYATPEAKTKSTQMGQRANMLGRLQEPGEVAQAALFLCSSHARYITGSCLVADAGYTALGPLGKELHIPKRS
jgi:NAD(P)-dependent dehydrogenase (short-subunit alcohol dehydrogenase family)